MRIYFMGICGTAMGNVALLLRKQGHEIIGADEGIYPPMSHLLLESDITLLEGYNPERLQGINPDKIVVGNVITRGNPEIEWLLETRAFPYCSLPELIRDEVLADRHNIVITGTHGKTTTTTLTAYLLEQAKAQPGYLIGGVPLSLPNGAELGNPTGPFVIEGDEYDSAFFDKRSKFVHYLPSILVINNLEFDHADIFRDLEDVQRSFNHVTRLVPKNGYILVNGDDENIKHLTPINWTNVIKIGESPDNDLQIQDFSENNAGSKFTLVWKGKKWATVNWKMHGIYNARNAAMAAMAAALTLYPQNITEFKLDSLGDFSGIKRRQEILHQDDNLIVVEDFAHHPTALKFTIESLKARYPEHELIACFEPRSNTACRQFHQETFKDALSYSRYAYIGPVHRPHLYEDHDRLDTKKMADELNALGTQAKAFESNEALMESLISKSLNKKHLVCFFSNGSFDGIIKYFIQKVSKAAPQLIEKE